MHNAVFCFTVLLCKCWKLCQADGFQCRKPDDFILLRSVCVDFNIILLSNRCLQNVNRELKCNTQTCSVQRKLSMCFATECYLRLWQWPPWGNSVEMCWDALYPQLQQKYWYIEHIRSVRIPRGGGGGLCKALHATEYAPWDSAAHRMCFFFFFLFFPPIFLMWRALLLRRLRQMHSVVVQLQQFARYN